MWRDAEEPLSAGHDVMYCGNAAYAFYRLYSIIYERLLHSKELCDADLYTEQHMTAHVGRWRDDRNPPDFVHH